MFTVEERNRVRDRLLAAAEADPAIAAAALTGSEAVGEADRWSDLDLALSVTGDPRTALADWTRRMYDAFGARHHWDLPSGSTTYRVFLLPGWLEVDLAFTPEADFGPRGPRWRTVFGPADGGEASGPPSARDLAGLAWHHAWHARVCVERGRWWQAEQWIGALRGQILALACLRLGRPTAHAKGAHLLPEEAIGALEGTLVRSLDETELRRALDAAVAALAAELGRAEGTPEARLVPMLAELTGQS
jgi:hypothetical protein